MRFAAIVQFKYEMFGCSPQNASRYITINSGQCSPYKTDRLIEKSGCVPKG